MKSASHILSGEPFTLGKSHFSLGKYLHDQIQQHGSKTALVNAETNEEFTYEKIIHDTRKLSVYLKTLGLTTNDRIAICSENNLNFGTAVLSTLLLGITVCPVNPMYTETEFVHILSISKPKYIFVSSLVALRLHKIAKNLSWSPKLILLNEDASQSEIPNIDDIIKQVSDYDSKNLQFPKLDIENHVAGIFCSSGTTGMPKGVMLTDLNVLHLTERSSNFFDSVKSLNEKVTITGLMPLFHGYGFVMLFLLALPLGAKMVLFPRFEERKFLRAIEKYNIGILTLVPTVMEILLKSSIVGQYDLSSVKEIITGGARMPLETEKAIMKLFNLDSIHSLYGLTEASFGVINNKQEFNKVGSIGKLEPGFLAKVVPIDDGKSKEALGPNCKGELCFKSPAIMKGYCDDLNSTKAMIDEDGWLHTGDVGYYDVDGYFYIVDRIKELIKYKGYQVAPAELEAILMTHPSIKMAAVVGLPDKEAGELPLAFVVKDPDSKLTEDEVINYVKERVSSQKRLRGGVKFVNEIPKNSTGKILRRELRNMLKSNL